MGCLNSKPAVVFSEAEDFDTMFKPSEEPKMGGGGGACA